MRLEAYLAGRDPAGFEVAGFEVGGGVTVVGFGPGVSR